MKTKKAIKYGVRIAQAFGVPIQAITIGQANDIDEVDNKVVSWLNKLLRRVNVSFDHKYLVGDPASIISKEAGDNHIIVMGSSTKNPILKFFAGSKPLEVMKNSNCPILIVK